MFSQLVVLCTVWSKDSRYRLKKRKLPKTPSTCSTLPLIPSLDKFYFSGFLRRKSGLRFYLYKRKWDIFPLVIEISWKENKLGTVFDSDLTKLNEKSGSSLTSTLWKFYCKGCFSPKYDIEKSTRSELQELFCTQLKLHRVHASHIKPKANKIWNWSNEVISHISKLTAANKLN